MDGRLFLEFREAEVVAQPILGRDAGAGERTWSSGLPAEFQARMLRFQFDKKLEALDASVAFTDKVAA